MNDHSFFSNIHFFIDQDQKVVCVHTPVVATIVEREIEYEQDTKIIMDGLLQNEALNGFVQHELVRRYMGRSNKNLDRILHQQDPDTQGAINIEGSAISWTNTYTGRPCQRHDRLRVIGAHGGVSRQRNSTVHQPFKACSF